MALMKRFRFKNSSKSLLFRLAGILAFISSLVVVSLVNKKENKISLKEGVSKQIYVETPVVIDEASEKQILQYYSDHGIIPSELSASQIRKVLLPNSCASLYVTIKIDGEIFLNSETHRNINNTDVLKQRLRTIFHERDESGVYEENSLQVVKRVIIKAPGYVKYNDTLRVIDAVSESGAEPIILVIDDPFQINSFSIKRKANN